MIHEKTASLLIVLYDCEIDKSQTIKSLIKEFLDFVNLKVVIWNNGPNKIAHANLDQYKIHFKDVSLYFFETPNNYPLSWIYNYYLKKFSSDFNIIFDHDSELNSKYLSAAFNQKLFFVRLPLIHALGALRSPTVNGEFFEGPFRRDQNVISIGSGIVLSRDAVREIEGRYGSVFDEHFALYGVDTSFFVRIYKAELADRLETIPGFEHSLSRLEKESDEMTKFRRTERTYDFALMLRHYPSMGQLKSLVKQAFLLLVGRSRLDLGVLIKTLISGRHPRTTNNFRILFVELTKQHIKNG